jgi:hypothetical protein
MAPNDVSLLESGVAAITMDSQHVDQLTYLMAATEDLKQVGYIVAKLSPDELEQKKRCPTCGLRGESASLAVSSPSAPSCWWSSC